MPRFDGTGPRGEGPFTGRGEGYCVMRLPDEGNESAVGHPDRAPRARENHVILGGSSDGFTPIQPGPRVAPWRQGPARAWARPSLWQLHRMERPARPCPGRAVQPSGARRRTLRRFSGRWPGSRPRRRL